MLFSTQAQDCHPHHPTHPTPTTAPHPKHQPLLGPQETPQSHRNKTAKTVEASATQHQITDPDLSHHIKTHHGDSSPHLVNQLKYPDMRGYQTRRNNVILTTLNQWKTHVFHHWDEQTLTIAGENPVQAPDQQEWNGRPGKISENQDIQSLCRGGSQFNTVDRLTLFL